MFTHLVHLVLWILLIGYGVFCAGCAVGIYRDSHIPEDPSDPRRRFWYLHFFLIFTVRQPLSALIEKLAVAAYVVAEFLMKVSEWLW